MTDDTDEVQEDFNVFDDSIDLDKEPEKEPEAEEEPEGEEAKSDNDDDSEEEAEPPAAENKTKVGQMAALKAERQARQQLQEENRRLREQYEPDVDPNEPDPSIDPQGYKEWAKAKAKEELFVDRINNSRAEMLKVDDYEEMETVFAVLANRDRSLIEKMNKHPDPARFAYETATKYEAEREEKLRLKIMGGKPEAKDAKPKRRAPDLTGATAIGSNTTRIETMADDDDLFEDSPFRVGVKRK